MIIMILGNDIWNSYCMISMLMIYFHVPFLLSNLDPLSILASRVDPKGIKKNNVK